MDPVSPNSPAAGSPGKNPILVYVLADSNDQAISDAILKHLKPIVRDFPLPIEIDSDFSAPPGADRERYQARLFEANIVLALISSDFIDNDTLYARNQSVMDRHNRGQTVMIPVLIRNCMWKRTPFARLNVLPRNYQPLNNRQFWNSQDDAIMAVVEDIDRSLNELARQGAIEIAPAPAAAGPAPASAAARPRPAVSRRPATGAAPTPAPKPAAAVTPSKPANLGEQLALAAATIGVSSSSAGSAQPEKPAAAAQGDWRRSYYWGAFWKRGLALFLDYLLSGSRDGGGAAGRRQRAREFRQLGLARSDRRFSGLLLSGVSLLRVEMGGDARKDDRRLANNRQRRQSPVVPPGLRQELLPVDQLLPLLLHNSGHLPILPLQADAETLPRRVVQYRDRRTAEEGESQSGRRSGRVTGARRALPIWVFLASGLFQAEGPVRPGCAILDWLGFSRPNRDFSTGCAPRSRRQFFPAPGHRVGGVGMSAHGFGAGNVRIGHGGQIKLNSDFLQGFV